MGLQEHRETRSYAGDELDRLCHPIFEKLYSELGERYRDWIVAIEPETGDYFIGLDDYEVLNRARIRVDVVESKAIRSLLSGPRLTV